MLLFFCFAVAFSYLLWWFFDLLLLFWFYCQVFWFAVSLFFWFCFCFLFMFSTYGLPHIIAHPPVIEPWKHFSSPDKWLHFHRSLLTQHIGEYSLNLHYSSVMECKNRQHLNNNNSHSWNIMFCLLELHLNVCIWLHFQSLHNLLHYFCMRCCTEGLLQAFESVALIFIQPHFYVHFWESNIMSEHMM